MVTRFRTKVYSIHRILETGQIEEVEVDLESGPSGRLTAYVAGRGDPIPGAWHSNKPSAIQAVQNLVVAELARLEREEDRLREQRRKLYALIPHTF